MMDDKDGRWRTKQFFSNLVWFLITVALAFAAIVLTTLNLAELINAGLDRLMRR